MDSKADLEVTPLQRAIALGVVVAVAILILVTQQWWLVFVPFIAGFFAVTGGKLARRRASSPR